MPPYDDDKSMTLSVANALSPILRFTNSIDVVVATPYINDAVSDGGRRSHSTIGCVIPHLCPSCRIEGVKVPAVASHIDHAVGDGGEADTMPPG